MRRAATNAEMALRRELHGRGLRYRVDQRPDPSVRTRADIVFTRAKVAVFVDGCFWHGCPDHWTEPRSNREWWIAKIQANQTRDAAATQQLVKVEWRVIRIWEHEDPELAAVRVAVAVAAD